MYYNNNEYNNRLCDYDETDNDYHKLDINNLNNLE